MAPKPTQTPVIDYDALAAKHGGVDAPIDYDSLASKYGGVDDTASPISAETLTANPKGQGTYRMLAPSGSDIKGGIMVPYGNVKAALSQRFGWDPQQNDYSRYAHNLFTELNNKGQAPKVESPSDKELLDQYGVVPTPAPGTKEYDRRNQIKTAHFAIDSLPPVMATVGGALAAVPGAALGPGEVAAIGAGGAAGAGEGEVWKQELNQRFFGEQQTPKEAAINIGIQAGIGALQEVGSRAAAKPLGKLADYLGYTAKASEKAGFRMLPSEAHGTKPTVFETYPKGSIFTSGTMAEWRELQNQETEKAAKNLADSISTKSLGKTGSREEAGDVIRKGIETHMEKFRNLQSSMYNKIAKSTKNINVSRDDMVAFARQELQRLNAAQKAGGNTVMSPFRQRLQAIVTNNLRVAPFSAMKDLRSALIAEASNRNEILSGPEKGFLKKMAGIIDGSMEDSLKKSGIKGLPELWRSANSVTREEHEKFVENLVKNLADKKNPEDIALVLRGNSPSAIAPIGIQETRDAMSVIPKSMIPRVQKQILLDTMYEATGKGTQSFDEGLFAKKILQIGDERGEVLFGKNWGKVKDFSELLNKMREKGGLSAANLSNPEVVKQVWTQVGRMAAEAFGSALSTRALGGSLMADVASGVFPLASEATLWKTIAAALTHPETASKLVDKMATTVRLTPFLGYESYNATKALNPERAKKVRDYIKQSSDNLIPASTPAAPVPPPATAIPSGQAYNHVAVHPVTGHAVGSIDGKTWFDVKTGEKVA